MTVAKKSAEDLVQFCSRTICYHVRDDALYVTVKDFEVRELGQDPNPVDSARPTTSVEFDAGISEEEALDALRLIVEDIEENGLPETIRKMPREHAALGLEIQRLTEELGADVEKLPPELRDWGLSLLTRLGEPAPHLRLVSDRSRGGEEAADEGNDHE
jgi:hypothetical protein